jgi:hypothetical protein
MDCFASRARTAPQTFAGLYAFADFWASSIICTKRWKR